MQVHCPKCQLVLNCPPEQAGQQVRCPRCEQIMQLPGNGPVPFPPINALPQNALPQNALPPMPLLAVEPAPPPLVSQLNVRSKSRRAHDRSGSSLANFVITILVFMMGPAAICLVICCGMVRMDWTATADTDSGDRDGSDRDNSNDVEFNAESTAASPPLSRRDEWGLILYAFDLALDHVERPNTFGMDSAENFVFRNGDQVRVVGPMTEKFSVPTRRRIYSVDFTAEGDHWNPVRVVIDEKEFWHIRQGPPRRRITVASPATR